VSFYQPRFDTLYRADEAVVCQGVSRRRLTESCVPAADQTGRPAGTRRRYPYPYMRRRCIYLKVLHSVPSAISRLLCICLLADVPVSSQWSGRCINYLD